MVFVFLEAKNQGILSELAEKFVFVIFCRIITKKEVKVVIFNIHTF